jgi:hypothetical protein
MSVQLLLAGWAEQQGSKSKRQTPARAFVAKLSSFNEHGFDFPLPLLLYDEQLNQHPA